MSVSGSPLLELLELLELLVLELVDASVVGTSGPVVGSVVVVSATVVPVAVSPVEDSPLVVVAPDPPQATSARVVTRSEKRVVKQVIEDPFI